MIFPKLFIECERTFIIFMVHENDIYGSLNRSTIILNIIITNKDLRFGACDFHNEYIYLIASFPIISIVKQNWKTRKVMIILNQVEIKITFYDILFLRQQFCFVNIKIN